MIVKTKIYWKIFSFLFALFGSYLIYMEIIINKDLTFGNILLIISSILMIPILIFILPTLQVEFKDKKMILSWKISLGFKKLYECCREVLYNQISITDWTFYFTRFHILYVTGPNNFGVFFCIFLTKKKETFLILSEYAKPRYIDDDAKKILSKYKKKYKDKIDIKKLIHK